LVNRRFREALGFPNSRDRECGPGVVPAPELRFSFEL
jgi:hypothetical protein